MNPASPAPSTSIWEDFVDIFYAPSDVFERRRDAGFGIPLAVLVVAIGLIYIIAQPVLQPIFDAEFARATADAMQDNAQAAAQIEQGRTFFDKTQYFLVPFGTLLSVFILSIGLWIVVKFFDLKLEFKAASVIATYAVFPRILEQLLALLQGFILSPSSLDGPFSVTLGLGRFFDPDTVSPILLAVLARFDVFVIWVTVLVAIGVTVIAKADRRKAMMVAITLWILGLISPLLTAIQKAS